MGMKKYAHCQNFEKNVGTSLPTIPHGGLAGARGGNAAGRAGGRQAAPRVAGEREGGRHRELSPQKLLPPTRAPRTPSLNARALFFF